MQSRRRVYMDCNATVAIRPGVMASMSAVSDVPLNPSSIHSFGRGARQLLDQSRASIAAAIDINLSKYDIIFTASGTEANNLVLRSFDNGDIIISQVEHLSIYQQALALKNYRLIPVDQCGIVDLQILDRMLSETTFGNRILVSVIYASNETGVINDINSIAEICRKHGAYLHTDATQVLGKIPLSFTQITPDFATISSHKIGGPCGIAALIGRKDAVRPFLIGGGQEFGLRSGTENVLGAVGFAKAVELAVDDLEHYRCHTRKLRDFMEFQLGGKAVIIGASAKSRLTNTSLIAMKGVDCQLQIMVFDLAGFAVSNGAACTAGVIQESRILRALGYDESITNSSIRVSISQDNTEIDIQEFITLWLQTYNRLSKNATS